MSVSRHLLRSAQRTRSTTPSAILRTVLPTSTTVHVRHIKTPAYPEHIPLNWAENAFMAVGSAIMSLVDPRRGGI
jgi:ubiquinone biosynthesis protein COQ4